MTLQLSVVFPVLGSFICVFSLRSSLATTVRHLPSLITGRHFVSCTMSYVFFYTLLADMSSRPMHDIYSTLLYMLYIVHIIIIYMLY